VLEGGAGGVEYVRACVFACLCVCVGVGVGARVRVCAGGGGGGERDCRRRFPRGRTAKLVSGLSALPYGIWQYGQVRV
jgi:hypothetical protein